MNIGERRTIPLDIYPFIKQLKYPSSNTIKLFGSSGLKSQLYPSDYDLFQKVSKSKCSIVYKNILDIITKSLIIPNMYLVDFKIQDKKGKKIREYDNYKKFCKIYNDIDYIKLDYIIFINNRFTELSIIYSFTNLPSKEYFKASLLEDIESLIKEKKYFKVLKRYFSILLKERKTVDTSNILLKLNSFFNSQLGRLYQTTSNLKAIKTILEHKEYSKEDNILKRVKLNLKEIDYPTETPTVKAINNLIKKNEKIYNKEAIKVLKELF